MRRVQNSGGETKSYRGRYLVGCDGAHSVVRGELGWGLEGKTYQYGFYWLTFAFRMKGINFHGPFLRPRCLRCCRRLAFSATPLAPALHPESRGARTSGLRILLD